MIQNIYSKNYLWFDYTTFKTKKFWWLLFIIVLTNMLIPQQKSDNKKISSVSVIAPSVSTSIKAREVRISMGWEEVPVKRADVLLVVVRSSLFNPLYYFYESYCDLKEYADYQLNISGPKYHIYLYSIDDNLRANQIEHETFEADY